MALGVAAAIVLSVTGGTEGGGGDLTDVRGVIGSEKQPFFRDPAVGKAFAARALRVAVDTSGSRDIASSTAIAEVLQKAGIAEPIEGTERDYWRFERRSMTGRRHR